MFACQRSSQGGLIDQMFNWLVRILLSLAGVLAAWFVAPESGNFEVVRMGFALLLIVFFVGLAAFWPNIISWFEGSGGERHR